LVDDVAGDDVCVQIKLQFGRKAGVPIDTVMVARAGETRRNRPCKL